MRKVFQRKLPIGSGSMSACRVSNIHHTIFSQSLSQIFPVQICYLGCFPHPLTSLTFRWEGSGWATASGPQTVQEQTGLCWAHGYEAALQLPGALPGHRQGEVRGQDTSKEKSVISYSLILNKNLIYMNDWIAHCVLNCQQAVKAHWVFRQHHALKPWPKITRFATYQWDRISFLDTCMQINCYFRHCL